MYRRRLAPEGCVECETQTAVWSRESPAHTENTTVMPAGTVLYRMSPSNTHAERQPSHKATLYCPDCDHASRINGDWLIRVRSDSVDYKCPECGYTIDSRADGAALTTQSGGALQFRPSD